MDAASGSAAPVLRYFCSQAHCEEGKKDHEVTMKEYNVELARKESVLVCKQEELEKNTGPLNEQQGAEWQQKVSNVEVDLKRERENHKLEDSNDQGVATATTTAADPGPVKTSAEQPQDLKTASLSKEGMKEGRDGEMDSATAKAAASAATAATIAGAGAFGVKQCGISLDPTPFNNATTVLCSHPGCSQPGTKFCASCKTTGYCSAECQTADWPYHKGSCEGRLEKMGKDYLEKALAFHRNGDWSNLLKYCDLALTKLNLMKKKPLENITQACEYKIDALRALGRCEEALEISNNLNKIGASLLFLAAQNGHLAAVQKLLGQGADKDKTRDDGASPLWIAAQNGHLAVVQYLLEQGADKDKAKNTGATPLYVAAQEGHLIVVQYLLEHGADKDKAKNDGVTPLHIAAQEGHTAVVQCLLQHGADMNKAADDGRLPIDVAANEEIKQLIRDEKKRLKSANRNEWVVSKLQYIFIALVFHNP